MTPSHYAVLLGVTKSDPQQEMIPLIKVTLPNGIVVETDTAAEAAIMLARLDSRPPRVQIPLSQNLPLGSTDKVKRTRKVVRNWELSVLEGWVLEHDVRDPKQKDAVLELARRLGRTEGGARNLVRRYLADVYTVSSPNDNDRADYDVTKDPSRGESK